MQSPAPPEKPLAFLGARACELAALAVQDRVFLGGPYVDPDYQARRQNLFVLAVNCGRAASTCFCTSMNTGPAVREGADLSLFELPDHFVIEVGSEQGGEVIAAAPWRPCTLNEVAQARKVPQGAEAQIQRRLDTRDIRNLLLNNLEHERWDQVASRCLACACAGPYDVGLIEGSVTTGHDVERIKEIRKQCRYLVTIGSLRHYGRHSGPEELGQGG